MEASGEPPAHSQAAVHLLLVAEIDDFCHKQLYHREDARSNSLPPEVLHSSVYQPPLRERFNSLDSNYCSAAEHRAGLNRVGQK